MDTCSCFGVTILLLLIVVIYKYLTRNNGYWKSKGIPEADGAVFGFGHALDQLLMKKNMGVLTKEIYDRHPNDSMVGIYMNQLPVLVVRHPDLVKFVLQSGFPYFSENLTVDREADPLLFYDPFFQSGQKWKDSRAIFVSAFSSKKLKNTIPSITDNCEKLVEYLERKCGNKHSIELEVKDLFSKYTLGVAANSILSIDGHAFIDREEKNSLRSMMDSLFEISVSVGIRQNLVFALPVLSRWFSTGFTPKWVNEGFQKIVKDVESARKTDGILRNDILQHIKEYLKDKNSDRDELPAHTYAFFVEQYETSSLTLSLLCYLAAKYPEIQQKMRDEVEEILKKYGTIYSYEAINDMIYLEQAIKEALRLFPPGGRMMKFCSKPVTLEGPDGLTCSLKKGEEVHISVFGLHLDPKYWDNPEEFIPERFNKENEKQRPSHVYLAFGEGPRMCPGLRMAFLQVRAAMATVLKHYIIEPSPKMREPVQMDPRYALTTIYGGYWLSFKKRNH